MSEEIEGGTKKVGEESEEGKDKGKYQEIEEEGEWVEKEKGGWNQEGRVGQKKGMMRVDLTEEGEGETVREDGLRLPEGEGGTTVKGKEGVGLEAENSHSSGLG